jgi:hypothetical protein
VIRSSGPMTGRSGDGRPSSCLNNRSKQVTHEAISPGVLRHVSRSHTLARVPSGSHEPIILQTTRKRQFLWQRNITLKSFRLSDCLGRRTPPQQVALFEPSCDSAVPRNPAVTSVPPAVRDAAMFRASESSETSQEGNLRQFLWQRNITLKSFRLSDCLGRRTPPQQVALFVPRNPAVTSVPPAVRDAAMFRASESSETESIAKTAESQEGNLRQFLWQRNITLKSFRLSDCLGRRTPFSRRSAPCFQVTYSSAGAFRVPRANNSANHSKSSWHG